MLWTGETELRGPLDKDRDVVSDSTFIERTMFFGYNVLNHRALFIREALGQAVNDSHEGPGFGFFGHCKIFDLTSSRVNGPFSPGRLCALEWTMFPSGFGRPLWSMLCELKLPVTYGI